MPGDAIEATERWFVHRGLPHFVERHDSAAQIWGRALPLLVVAYLLLGLNALDLFDWSILENLGAVAFVLAVLVVTWVVANLVRGRRALERPREVGMAELAVFIVAPAIPSILFGQWADGLETAIEAVVILAILWAITSYGVPSLVRWAGGRALGQLALLFNLVVRALPLLLLFTTFLFINAEVWQVAGTLNGIAYLLVLGIFFVLGAVFILSRVPTFMRRLNAFDSWAEIGELVGGTPAAEVCARLAHPPDEVPHPGRPTIRQRFNIGMVTIFSQAIQITLVALTLTGFFVLFGVLAIPEDTIAAWTGLETVHVIRQFDLGGRTAVLSEPLIRVAAFLGAFTGMYFTVLLSTDATYREEFAEDVGPQLRQALAVRCVYREARTSVA